MISMPLSMTVVGWPAIPTAMLGLVRELIVRTVGLVVPPLTPYTSRLSERTQWKFTLTSPGQVMKLLSWLEPFLFTKRSQAQLALFARKTDDIETRERAIDLIQGLNHGTVSEDAAQYFLRPFRS